MGNCQAVDAAALVIQHPNGRQERMYWSITASEVMKMNPGHHVSIIIPLPVTGENQTAAAADDESRTVRFTRVKLLRPRDTLVLGRAYRLITTQEVMRVIKAKKYAKMKKYQAGSGENLQMNSGKQRTSSEEVTGKSAYNNQANRPERYQQRSSSTNLSSGKPKSWRPSLQSISESVG